MPPLILKDVIKATNPAGKSIYIVMLKGSNTEVDEICRGKKELKKFKKEFDAFNYIVDHRQDLLNSVPVTRNGTAFVEADAPATECDSASS